MASIFIQTALLMGFVLLAVRRRILSFGSLAFVFTITAALLAVIRDEYTFVPVAFVAGLAADLLVRRLRPADDTGGFRVFAFAVPALYYALYFAAVQATGGVGWSIHMWTGAVVIAGIIGVLLSYLVVPPARADHRTA
jgi:hypothetical protein